MSSLAAARADGFYHPPDWDPNKTSRKKFQGSRGANQYEKYGVIRFELPYDGWCEGCERHYGKGTRFNAKKEKDGMYFRTQIFKFTMKCHSCSHELVIATDPKNTDYDFRSGIKKKDEEFSVDREDGVDSRIQEKLDEIYKVGGHAAVEERHARETNAIYKLEHENDDKKRVLTESERLQTLYASNQVRQLYDYDANAVLRQTMRGKRRAEEALDREAKARGLSVKLLPGSETDQHETAQALSSARELTHARTQQAFRLAKKKQMLSVNAASIFGEASDNHQKHVKHAMFAAANPSIAAAARRTVREAPTSHEDGTAQQGAVPVVVKHVAKKKKKKLRKNRETHNSVEGCANPRSDKASRLEASERVGGGQRRGENQEASSPPTDNPLSALSALYDPADDGEDESVS
uniref:Splicing factor YJU2 n=1 Tax=Rhizochromulina marina TaxID=1034831 RepID=A0A7S2WQQ1_9STRA|mmetsp:Transcript_3123/g.9027  ORF Transcript_3123/g.9027 Transcript_3123/m.9027 type:complete len:407 (+) Transcript_3123:42-1262(+)